MPVRWNFSMEMEDGGRMLSRAFLPFDHSMVTIKSIASSKTNKTISSMVVVEAEADQKQHIEALLWKIHGMIQLNVAKEESCV
jgi:hypothetical protein